MENKQLEAALNEINELKAALSLKQSGIISSRLAAIVDSSDDAIISKDLNSIVITWNKGAEKIFGYTSAEMVGTSIMRLIPADRQAEENFILGKIRRGEKVDHFETRRLTKEGRLIDVSVCASPIKDATGKVIGVSKIARNITERKQAESRIRYLNRVYAVLSDINQTIVREKNPAVMLNTACRIAVEKGQFRMAWVGMADKTARYVKLTAHAGATADTLKILPGLLGDETHDCACSLTLQALKTGAHATCNDIEHDPQTVVWRNDALQRGYRAMASLPLKVEHKVVGTFNLYADESDFFDAEELRLMDELAMDIGFALEVSQRETARHASEASYRTLFDCAPDGIVIADPQSYYLDANASICRMLGYTREELIGKHAADIVVPEEIENIEPALRAIKSHSDYHREWKFRRKDGSVFDAEVIATAMPNGNLMGMIRDITERKRAQDELRWKTAFLEAQATSSPDGILVVDSHHKRILQNQRLIELFHVPKEIAEDDDDAKMLRHVTAQVKNPEQFLERVAHLYAHPDKIGRDEIELANGMILDRYSSPVLDETGKYYGRIWAFRDITERKRSEESLRLLESAIKQTKESIMITEANLDLPGPKIIFVNPAFTQMTGYTAQEVIGKTPRILQGLGTDRTVVKRLRENLERGETFEGEAVNYRKGGKEFDMEWQIAPLRDAGGKITHFVATQRDITERKKLEAQFRQSQKMEGIGQLAGGVAHDFNNILAIIQMQSELLKSSGGLSASQAEFADEIGLTVQRAAALTRQLLLFSRREVFQPLDLDLSASITSTAKMLGRILGENIQMQLKLASQPMFIHADAGMIDQVLLNLTVNARDAMPNGGQLVIETSGAEFDEFAASQSAQARIGSYVRLSVSDSGCGIPPEILPRIFEPFFTTKDVGKGTGLGLATVFGIVKQHQGWINVYSEVNHGTTFRIYLPRLAKNGGPKSAPPTLATLRGGQETILLVEDDPPLRLSVSMVLSQLGYRILEAPTGVKALEIWHENRNEISLLLTDLVMPDGMTGKNLAQHILQENPKLKVIFMSGYCAEVVGKDFPLKEGVNFLTKPFEAVKLAQAVRNSLDQPA
jgi:PAS domain S-box-containing protein